MTYLISNNIPSHPTVSKLLAQYSDMLIPEAHDKHSAVKARQQMLSPSRKPTNKLSMINSI